MSEIMASDYLSRNMRTGLRRIMSAVSLAEGHSRSASLSISYSKKRESGSSLMKRFVFTASTRALVARLVQNFHIESMWNHAFSIWPTSRLSLYDFDLCIE